MSNASCASTRRRRTTRRLTIDDLFREAARNHQLERAYQTQRSAAKVKRREADQERRAAVAQAFLSDPTQRAIAHPAPTPKRCYITSEHGRMLFDVSTDLAPAREVPLEAHRRFRARLACPTRTESARARHSACAARGKEARNRGMDRCLRLTGTTVAPCSWRTSDGRSDRGNDRPGLRAC